MRQAGTEWQLAEQGETPGDTGEGAAPSAEGSTPDNSSVSAGAPNDILKKLMQQREQELK
jgi:hypothetical protein